MLADSFATVELLYYLFGILSAIAVILGKDKSKEIIPFMQSIIEKIIGKKKDISDHFQQIKPPENQKIDFFFYPFDLNKTIPIMDWWYLEYIKVFNKKNKIKKLIIFPTIGVTRINQTANDIDKFSENIRKILKGSGIEIEFIDPYKTNDFDKGDLISNDFITTLKYIGSKKYFDFLLDNFKIKITSISDFNKYRHPDDDESYLDDDEPHPDDDKIKNIFIHICKSWGIVNYIKKNVIINNSVNISTIFWEWEVDKFGVIAHYLSRNNQVHYFPILGRTQMLNKTKSIPDIENKSICIFDDSESMITKVITFMPFLKRYNSLLECVLSQYEVIKRKDIINNGEEWWKAFKFIHDTPQIKNLKVGKDFFLFLGLIEKIKAIY